jgi:hypothetical protein
LRATLRIVPPGTAWRYGPSAKDLEAQLSLVPVEVFSEVGPDEGVGEHGAPSLTPLASRHDRETSPPNPAVAHES